MNHLRHQLSCICRYKLILLIILFSTSFQARAHAPNENYIWLNVETDHILGRFEVHIDDLKTYIDIDVDAMAGDRKTATQTASGKVQAYVTDNFSLSANEEPVPLQWLEADVFEENTDYLQYWFKTDSIPEDNIVEIENRLFLDPALESYNKLHRSIVVIEYNKNSGGDFGSEHSALVFKADRTNSTLDLANPPTVLNWKEFLWQGVLHIIYGLDHVLFIIVLLLTTVLRPGNNGWEPVSGFKAAFFNTLKIITLFTIAHSITLSLAALQLVSLNIAFVESVIAFSIIAIGLNNLKPVFNSHAWLLVFIFGLFHGLGFASVMGDLHFRTGLMERILVMFNVGVELGQLAIVAIAFPILFLLRTSAGYHRFITTPLSLVAICIASVWVLQRTGLLAV